MEGFVFFWIKISFLCLVNYEPTTYITQKNSFSLSQIPHSPHSPLSHSLTAPDQTASSFSSDTASSFSFSDTATSSLSPSPRCFSNDDSSSSSAEDLFYVSIDVSDSSELAASHTIAGQYLQLRVPDFDKPSFLAIASSPSYASAKGAFEFLVKIVAGSTAELLCRLKRGDVVELSGVMGKGFDIDLINPPEKYSTVLIFATESGISPIRSLIESEFGASIRSYVRLYYGARNLNRMAYQDRFRDWEASGVKIVPVLSQPDDHWTGESGYVQAAFARAKQIYSPVATGAVLCGQKQMTERESPKEEVEKLILQVGGVKFLIGRLHGIASMHKEKKNSFSLAESSLKQEKERLCPIPEYNTCY